MNDRPPKRIVLTGGGTAGHVMVNVALIPRLRARGWEVHYVGSPDGIERDLIARIEPPVPYTAVKSGKLRRYLDYRNFIDPFRVLQGSVQAARVLGKLRPRAIFSKGGFVAVPVVWAAALRRIPVFLHESDLTPGLANRLSLPFAAEVFVTFPESAAFFPRKKKVVPVGPIVREELLWSDPARGRSICGFSSRRPTLLVMGGSLGAEPINRTLRAALPLLDTFQILHLTGRGRIDPAVQAAGYCQREFLYNELPDALAAADLVISRAGSTAIFELFALRKPMLLVPLPRGKGRGDQVENARYFADRGWARVLPEEDLTPERLAEEIRRLYREREVYVRRMEAAAGNLGNGLETIVAHLETFVR